LHVATHHPDGRLRTDVDYIVPLDGDDYLLPQALSAFNAIAHDHNVRQQLAAVRDHVVSRVWGGCPVPLELPEMVCGIPMIVDTERRQIDHPTLDFNNHTYSYQATDFLELMYRENRLAVGTVAVAPEAIWRAGGWDKSRLLHAEDWSLWLNVVATVHSYDIDVTRYVSAYRIHDTQSSQQPGIEQEWERDGYMLRRQLIARYAGWGSMRLIEAQGNELFTEEYLGLGAQDFINAIYGTGTYEV